MKFCKCRLMILAGLSPALFEIGTFFKASATAIGLTLNHFNKGVSKVKAVPYDIEYELRLGNYSEIEEWILEGEVDCGFIRLPSQSQLDTLYLEPDPLLAVLPKGHPMAGCQKFPITAFCQEPFILLERANNTEIADIFSQYSLKPQTRITTWDDYAIMSMVENGLGISMLHQLILKRTPYHIVTKELDVPASRNICFAVRNRKTASLAVRRFLEYLEYR